MDVVVCGGGPAGFIAAIASARNGARTLLIENYGFLGGMATAALVGPISKFNSNGKRVVRGIPEEFIQRLAKLGGARIDLPSGNVPFEAELYKLVSMRMVREAGVAVMLHAKVTGISRACGVEVAENVSQPGCQYVHVSVDGAELRVKARMVVDATGTGAVTAMVGLPWRYRHGENGEMQPMSLQFVLGGVDTEALATLMAEDGVKYRNFELADYLKEEVEAGRLKNFGGPWAVHGSVLRPGQLSVNATRYAGNAVRVEDITEAEITMREDVHTIVECFRGRHRAFRDCYLLHTAAQTGIRETRSIEGLYTLGVEDVVSPPDHPDVIALGAHPIDVHRAVSANTEATFLQGPYGIPYRCLVPCGSEGVIVAGGAFSATREAFASARVQAQCMAMGQAAGTAAALCAQRRIRATELDGSQLRALLQDQGAEVDRSFTLQRRNKAHAGAQGGEGGFKFIAAPFTPFDAGGNLNLKMVREQASRLSQLGVSGVFICGTTGEGGSLSVDERKALAEAWCKEAPSVGIDVLVHVGYSTVEAACLLAAHAEKVGAKGVASVVPIGLAAMSLSSCVSVLREVAQSSSLPFYYYHIPSVTQVPFRASDLLPLLIESMPTFAGIKFTHEDIDDFRSCVMSSPAGIKMYFGRDEMLLDGIEAGASGAVGSTYNYRTDIYWKILEAYQKENMEEARQSQGQATRYINIILRYGGLNAGKALMKILGVDCGRTRMPIQGLSAFDYESLRCDLKSEGFWC